MGAGQRLHAAEMASVVVSTMYTAAMGESHRAYGAGVYRDRDAGCEGRPAWRLKLKDARGAEITKLDHDGPACKAGMRMHDVILQMNGQVIEGEDQLREMLREMPVGRTVSFVVSRDGQTQTMTMTTADRRTVGLQAWEQHYRCRRRGLRRVRGNGFLDS